MAAKSKKALSVPVAVAAPAKPLTSPASTRRLESLAELGRENLAAVARSNLALSEGLGAIGQELLDCAKAAVASAGETASALLAAKTMAEVIELNNGLAQHTIESLLKRSTKLGELGITTANQTLAPFTKIARPAIP
jgi:hypothetical protein